MFSSMKQIFRGPLTFICRFCTDVSPNAFNRQCTLRSKCAISKIQSRFLSHRPVTVFRFNGSDSEKESSSDSDEEGGKRRRPEQLKLVYEVVKKSKLLSEEDHCKFRENLLSIGHVVNDSNIDAVIMGMCASLKNMEFGDSYLSFLKQREMEINVATMGRYMKLCHACGMVDDESKVINMWHSFREKLPLMDASTAENVIHGLSVTSAWKQGLDLISVVKETCTPSASTYSALIIAAFRNRDAEVGWNLLEECIKEEKIPLDKVYNAWLDEYCTLREDTNIDQCVERVEKLLHFLSSHEILVSMVVSKKLKYTFEKLDWHCRYTAINQRGACMACNGEMQSIFIPKSEFQVLSRTFLEKVLVGPDVFSKSSPEEVQAFQELIAKEAPFNTVIDGLNVGYSHGAMGRGSGSNPAAILQSVVAHFVDLSHKILVLGRTHMNKWPRKEMEYVRKNSQLFLAENISQDDPFLLYAAMSSGTGTCFLSRDLMRGHAYRLKCAEPSLAGVFRRWQLSHQMRLIGVTYNNRVNIKPPLEYSPTVQKIEGKWHVPCQEEQGTELDNQQRGRNPVVPRSHLDPPNTWLCISPKVFRAKSNTSRHRNEWTRNYSYD